MQIKAYVVIVGAGPAGAALASMLAPHIETLLIEKAEQPTAVRIGESLPAAARRLLVDMELWDEFCRQNHRPRRAVLSQWGRATWHITDSIADLDGDGWSLDRAIFDNGLRQEACRRGAAFLTGTILKDFERQTDYWAIRLERNGRPIEVKAGILVDATGRNARLIRQLVGPIQPRDRLVCSWCHCKANDAPDVVHILAEAGGWWYLAPLPAERRVIAFFTDADLPLATEVASHAGLLSRLQATPALVELLARETPTPDDHFGYCSARSMWPSRVAGDGWLGLGDAALACDPLSSQGLFHALYSALMGAGAILGNYAGDRSALATFAEQMASVNNAYNAHLNSWYSIEQRWPKEPFWRRRHIARQER